jgi:hypothetical protein
MWNRSVVSTLVFVALSFSSCFIIPDGAANESGAKQSRGAIPSTHPDLSGVWVLNSAADPSSYSNFAFSKLEPPMTTWAQEQYSAAKPVFGPKKTTAQESNDPVYGCFPPGLPRIYLQQRPMEILQLSNEVIVSYQYDRLVRHIYTDGRQHDEFLDPPLWMGDSVGKWEGDALVVDVIGFNDKTWLDRVGHPHSDALHLVEQFSRPAHGVLFDKITIEDPKAYTRPWTVRLQFQLKSGTEINWEEVCEDEKVRDRQ